MEDYFAWRHVVKRCRRANGGTQTRCAKIWVFKCLKSWWQIGTVERQRAVNSRRMEPRQRQRAGAISVLLFSMLSSVARGIHIQCSRHLCICPVYFVKTWQLRLNDLDPKWAQLAAFAGEVSSLTVTSVPDRKLVSKHDDLRLIVVVVLLQQWIMFRLSTQQ